MKSTGRDVKQDDAIPETVRKVLDQEPDRDRERKRSAWEHAARINRSQRLTHYQVLQVSPQASLADMKKRYNALALLLHTDKLKPPPGVEASSEEIEAPFKRLNEAWTVLKDPNSRREYDLSLEDGSEAVYVDLENEDEELFPTTAPLLGGEDPFSEAFRSMADAFEREYTAASSRGTRATDTARELFAGLAPLTREIDALVSGGGAQKLESSQGKVQCPQCRASKMSEEDLKIHLDRSHAFEPFIDGINSLRETDDLLTLLASRGLDVPTSPVSTATNLQASVALQEVLRPAEALVKPSLPPDDKLTWEALCGQAMNFSSIQSGVKPSTYRTIDDCIEAAGKALTANQPENSLHCLVILLDKTKSWSSAYKSLSASKKVQPEIATRLSILSLLLAGPQARVNLADWLLLGKSLSSPAWSLLSRPLNHCFPDGWTELYLSALRAGSMRLAEWYLRSTDTQPDRWLQLAAAAFVVGASNTPQHPWVKLAKSDLPSPWSQVRRCLDMADRSAKQITDQPANWLRLAESQTKYPEDAFVPTLSVSRLILCCLENARQIRGANTEPSDIWAAAAVTLARSKVLPLAQLCFQVSNSGLDVSHFWRLLAEESSDIQESILFLALELKSSASLPLPKRSQALIRFLSALRNHDEKMAVEAIVLLIKVKGSLDPIGQQQSLGILAELLESLRIPKPIVLGTLEAALAVETGSSSNPTLVSSMTAAAERLRGEFKVEDVRIRAGRAYKIFATSLGYNEVGFVNLLLQAFHNQSADILTEFLRLYKTRFVDGQNEAELYPQVSAVVMLTEGIIALINNSVNEACLKITTALTLAPSKEYARAAAELLCDPRTRVQSLQSMRQSLLNARTLQDLIKAPWLSTPLRGKALDDSQLPDKFLTPHNRFNKKFMAMIRSVRSFEFRIGRVARTDGHFEAAMCYLNMSRTAPAPSVTIGCFLQASRHLLALQHDPGTKPAQKFAAVRLIHIFIELTLRDQRYHLAIRMQILRTGISLLLHSFAAVQGIPGAVPSELISRTVTLISDLAYLSRYFPVFGMPSLRAFDCLSNDISMRGLSQNAVTALETRLQPLLDLTSWTCLKLEGVWYSWIDDPTPDDEPISEDEDDNNEDESTKISSDDDDDSGLSREAQRIAKEARIQEARRKNREARLKRRAEREARAKIREWNFLELTRFTAIGDVLASAGVAWEEVAKSIDCMQLPRDDQGFLDAVKGQTAQMYPLASFDGFQIDKNSGELRLRVTPTSSTKPGTFAWSDVAAAMKLALVGPLFSLDEIDSKLPHHPLQLMHFAPSTLRQTDLLAAMFHADYLLKFFTSGVEVSARPPFPLRPVRDLLRGLPAHLVSALTVCCGRGSSEGEVGKAHRFWLDAGDLPYESQENDSYLTIALGKQEMSVKKHLLQRNKRTGALEDCPLEESDTSREAEFCRKMGRHYEEIGRHFPIFLRLRELAKISAAVRLMVGIKEGAINSQTELSSKQASIYSDLVTSLPKNLKVDGFPQAQNEGSISKTIEDTISGNKVPFAHQAQVRREIRPRVVEALTKADTELVNSVVTQLAQTHGIPANLHSAVREHLSGFVRGTQTIANAISTATIAPHIARARRIQNSLSAVAALTPTRELQTGPTTPTSKGWVPAAFLKSEGHIVYGGVSLSSTLQQQRVQPPPNSSYHNSGTSIAAQLSNAIPNSYAQRWENARVNAQQRIFNLQTQNLNQFWAQHSRGGGGASRGGGGASGGGGGASGGGGGGDRPVKPYRREIVERGDKSFTALKDANNRTLWEVRRAPETEAPYTKSTQVYVDFAKDFRFQAPRQPDKTLHHITVHKKDENNPRGNLHHHYNNSDIYHRKNVKTNQWEERKEKSKS